MAFDTLSLSDEFSPFLALELWTLVEAAYLLGAHVPRREGDFIAYDRDGDGAVAQTYRSLKDSTILGSLPYLEADGTFMRRGVSPAHAIAWAYDRGLQVPDRISRGVCVDKATADVDVTSSFAQKGAAARHAISRQHRAIASGWYAVHGVSMSNAEAAEQLVKDHPIERSTADDWVKQFRQQLRKAGKLAK